MIMWKLFRKSRPCIASRRGYTHRTRDRVTMYGITVPCCPKHVRLVSRALTDAMVKGRYA